MEAYQIPSHEYIKIEKLEKKMVEMKKSHVSSSWIFGQRTRTARTSMDGSWPTGKPSSGDRLYLLDSKFFRFISSANSFALPDQPIPQSGFFEGWKCDAYSNSDTYGVNPIFAITGQRL